MAASSDGQAGSDHHAEFRDPRLVAVYDVECTWGPEDDFFVALVGRTPGARVLDLGCGTGRLTIALAAAGHAVTGIDPAPASLAAAQAKPGADAVTWIEGTAEAAPSDAFDVAVMTSHVAQFLLADDEWAQALGHLYRALVPGATLCFDGRDPRAREWERWNPVDSRRRAVLDDGQAVEAWTEVTGVDDGVVAFTHHTTFAGGTELTSTAALRFRTEQEVRDTLDQAGFEVEELYGGWQHQPVGAPDGDGELLVVAHRR